MKKIDAIKLMRKTLLDLKFRTPSTTQEVAKAANEALLAYDSAPSLVDEETLSDQIQARAEKNWRVVRKERGGDASSAVSAPVAMYSALEEIDSQLDGGE